MRYLTKRVEILCTEIWIGISIATLVHQLVNGGGKKTGMFQHGLTHNNKTILRGNRKEHTADMRNKIDGSQKYHAKWKKAEMKSWMTFSFYLSASEKGKTSGTGQKTWQWVLALGTGRRNWFLKQIRELCKVMETCHILIVMVVPWPGALKSVYLSPKHPERDCKPTSACLESPEQF